MSTVTKYAIQWQDAEHTLDIATLIEIYPDGRERAVDFRQDVYHAWLDAGNVPVEREYVPPKAPPPDLRTVAEITADEYMQEKNLERLVYDLLQRVEKLEATR